MTRLPFRFSAVLVGTVVLAVGSACGRERPVSESGDTARSRGTELPEAAFRAHLGTTWELARLGTQDLPPSPVRERGRSPGLHPGWGTRPTIRFSAEAATDVPSAPGALRAGGWSFCNGYGTGYVLGPADQLRFEGFQSTLVGCNGPDSVETRYFRGLANTRRFEIDSSTLSLVAEDGSRLTFVAGSDSAGPPF